MKRFILFFLFSISFSSLVAAQLKKDTLHYPDSWNDGKYYTVNGAKLWVVTAGKGEALILIAGGPGGTHRGLRSFDSLA